MGKIRGFLLKHRVHTVFRCFSRRRRASMSSPVKPISNFFRWTRNLRSKVKTICCGSVKKLGPGTGHGYTHLGSELDPFVEKKKSAATVPKGYLAVYVGQNDGDFERVLVPVIYFNHPLFGQLLREAEEEFGFDHPGAITIPCRISEFEHVQTRIKEGRVRRKFLTWK